MARLTFYKTDGSGERRSVYPTDSGAYLRSPKWSTNPPATSKGLRPDPPAKSPETADLELAPVVTDLSEENRKEQLEALLTAEGYRSIREIAHNLGITEKPAGGWDEAIPLILEKEFSKN